MIRLSEPSINSGQGTRERLLQKSEQPFARHGFDITVYFKGLLIYILLLPIVFGGMAKAQQPQSTRELSLKEAIELAKAQNNWVQIARTEVEAASAELKDAYNAALPNINTSTAYQRYSDLTLYTDGLNHSTTGPRKPNANAANLGMDASFILYSGGKQRSYQEEMQTRQTMAGINAEDQAGSYGLQTAGQYLDLVRLAELRKFILDQMKRAEARLKNINSLYKNQKVTRSDVLRAEVMLSNVVLSLQQVDNDLTIADQRLAVLLNLPDTVRIILSDSAGMPKPECSALIDLVAAAPQTSFAGQKAEQSINLQQTRVKSLKSNYLPTLSFITAYGLNYPNNLFFPPVDQAYSIGFVGLRAQYSISSLYQNKHKVNAGKLRLSEVQKQQLATADNIRQETGSLLIKYREALNRIAVKEKTIEQTQVNYRIVNTKYFNQLALLTDLLDADNLLTESRFDLIRAQTDALSIYYRLRYAAGKL